MCAYYCLGLVHCVEIITPRSDAHCLIAGVTLQGFPAIGEGFYCYILEMRIILTEVKKQYIKCVLSKRRSQGYNWYYSIQIMLWPLIISWSCFWVDPGSTLPIMLVDSQLVCLLPVRIFNHVIFICDICFIICFHWPWEALLGGVVR